MAGSTYSSNLKIELMSTGENSGTWGDITNTNMGTALEQAIVGLGNPDFIADANLTISITNTNAAQAARALVLNVTSVFGSLTATRELVVPTIQKQYIVQNNTAGGQSIIVKTSAGTGITVPNGRKAHLYVDGTNVIQMFDFVDINGGSIDGTPIGAAATSTGAFTSLTASGATTLNGAVALGDAAADLITVPGTLNSNLLFTDNSFDIGATGANRPRNLFLSGAATVAGNLSVGGTLTLTGGVNLNGNVTIGDAPGDTLTINATITSNLLFTDNTFDIGASGATRPRNLFLAGNATIGGAQTLTGALTVDSTTDSSSVTTGSIQTDGGVGIAKKLFVGLDANIQGLTVGRGAGAVATNTAVGVSALAANTTGIENGAFGVNALQANTTGNSNNAFGRFSLTANTTGGNNTSIGHAALANNTTASNNTAVGFQSGFSNTTGTLNVAIGDSALRANTTANNNSAVGAYALYANTTGAQNTALGQAALQNNTTASNNIAVGYQAGFSNTTGTSNTFTGTYAGYWVTGSSNSAFGYQTLSASGASGATGTNNSAFGQQALFANTSGSYNTGVGQQALNSNTTASNNTAVGYQAGYSYTGTAGHNTFIGRQAGYSSTTANGITAVGANVLFQNTTGISNVAVGGTNGVTLGAALENNTTGSNNTAIGHAALLTNTTASNNTAVGYQAGYSNTTGAVNTFVGGSAGRSNTTGLANSALGFATLFANTTGSSNTAIGATDNSAVFGALQNNTTGSNNSALGVGALGSNTTASNNTAVGYEALRANTTASENTAVGYQSGFTNSTGRLNTFIGLQAGFTSNHNTANGNTCVGSYAGFNLTTGTSNTFIGSTIPAGGIGSGIAMTTGSKNTILGNFTGNQGGLDIRTANNFIVLSDGDGNPRFIANNNQTVGINAIPNPLWVDWGGKSVIQFGNSGAFLHGGGSGWSASTHLYAANTGYFDGSFRRSSTLTGAAQYVQSGGVHSFLSNTGVGAVGDVIGYGKVLEVATQYTLALEGASIQVGTGITFPATQNASSNANTLDDYEEGTWTPAFSSESAGPQTVTYTAQLGWYTKIGRLVTLTFDISWSARTASGSVLIITGQPFSALSSQNVAGYIDGSSNVSFVNRGGVTGTQICATAYAANLIALQTFANGAANPDPRLDPSALGASGTIAGALTFMV